MGDEEHKRDHNKRKRKKSFLQNARKYAKKGHYGRGSQLDADTYQYFVKIMEAYRDGFPTEEEKLNFVNNVFEQTNGEEANCCRNQVGCRVVETLLPFANDGVLDKFMGVFSEDLRPLCSDRFATHVLEALVAESSKRSLNVDLDDETKVKFRDFTLKVSKFLLNNLEDYLWDTYGNHVIRKVIQSLAQLPQGDESATHKTPEVKVEEDVPEEYKEIVLDYAERLITWPQFKDLPYSEITSGFLQVLLKALRKVNKKLLKTYLKKLLEESFCPEATQDEGENHEDKLPDAFMSKSCVMLLETALQVAKKKRFTQIYAKCFAGRLVKLATTRATNFAVQKLLTHVAEKTEFESMFEELVESFKEILDTGHTGVLLAIGQACKRLSTKQGVFVQGIMKALRCLDSEEKQNSLVICLSRCATYEDCQKLTNDNLQKDKLNLHGTLILQLMLEFNKPIKIVNSILATDTNVLKNLLSNSMGSHIVDSYVKSQYVGEKSREKLVRKMQGTYQDLIVSKYGSRSFEAIWNAANLKFKMNIMSELGHKDAAWTNNEFGKIISAKLNYPLYKRNKEEWKNSLGKQDKSKNLLDFLDS